MSISRKNEREAIRHDYQMCRDRLLEFSQQAAALSSELGAVRHRTNVLSAEIARCSRTLPLDVPELEALHLERRDYVMRRSLLEGTLESIAMSKQKIEAQKERLRKELQEIEWLID